jgi:hypothetical protein
MKLTKAEAQRRHARERFKRRKNIKFTAELHQETVRRIRMRTDGAQLVRRESQRVSIWDVVVVGIRCRVVYDGKRNNIVTVLPERWNADYVQRWWER